MLKKELVVHIETNEEGEFIKVNALETDPGYFLLSLGGNRLVINGEELVDAMNSISYYATLFKQESIARENRIKAPPKAMTVTPTGTTRKRKVANPEDEGAIVLDPIMRLGPTESELALERQTKHMQGESLVLTEKK